ncbi:hypothetical protein MKEN_01182100 [Mycena kentingensis (nom. inval.)]|nr:hypothetical protein MKEN_01182100 [Mycena kentingensis (nom. inval.)]
MRAISSLLALLAAPLALASHSPSVNHHELAKRAKGDLSKREVFKNTRWTFYSTGLGACGDTNHDGDFIVALNQGTFGYSYPSPYCNRKIVMSYGGKTTTATIKDSCPGCPWGGLDLSPGLFSFFASKDMGVIQGTWYFAGEGGGDDDDDKPTTTKKAYTPPKTTQKAKTTTTTKEKPTTTSTKEQEEEETTTKTTSSTEARTSSSVASTTTHASSSAPASNSIAAPSGTVPSNTPAEPQNLYTFAQAIIGLSGVIVAGSSAQ